MFDPESAELLRSAPQLPGLDPNSLPQLLTKHYTELTSLRLRGKLKDKNSDRKSTWSLDRIADNYEVITSIHKDKAIRRSSAFVAATAQQIIARRQQYYSTESEVVQGINRDQVAPSLAAALLFLAAEQYADAREAALEIKPTNDALNDESTILCNHIINLAKGQLDLIISRGEDRRKNNKLNSDDENIETRALRALLDTLAIGIEMLAANILSIQLPYRGEIGHFTDPQEVFLKVQSLSIKIDDQNLDVAKDSFSIVYPGPHHLASLLISTTDGIYNAALTNVLPPKGAAPEFWKTWINFRANRFPYVWSNHRKAINQGFHENGVSSVMVLPTGAGKTTISSLKIAGVLASQKKVIFLAPTHALVEQLTNDLQEMFPKNLLGADVSSDFDLLFQIGYVLPEIEVMTPERCLAMMSFSADSFKDVGLLVFDECHLLCPQSGGTRRALDGMLCVLAFSKIVPSADFLFLSAMVKNGKEFAAWISNITNRDCIDIDLLWKPSRQARGVVIYEQAEIEKIKNAGMQAQSRADKTKGNKAINLRTVATKELKIKPYAIWGLQHNWLDANTRKAICTYTPISDKNVTLTGKLEKDGISLKPNVNDVASNIATACAKNNLKTIVFVNQKSHAISTAKKICQNINQKISVSDDEKLLWDALSEELGDLKHSLLDGPTIAVPHNASMLHLERDLSERMYSRSNGAMVIVATPTLAQGLNLPAQLAILAGDKRSVSGTSSSRQNLEAHEILNAAARAGRAGHLANGVVLLIPEPILTFPENHNLNRNVVGKLKSILPEDDRCVEIIDPLEIVLDKISSGEHLDRDVRYLVNRMSTIKTTDGENNSQTLYSLDNSFAAYKAKQNGIEKDFKDKLDILNKIILSEQSDINDSTLVILASQSGLPIETLSRLKAEISNEVGSLPISITNWIRWLLKWLSKDSEA